MNPSIYGYERRDVIANMNRRSRINRVLRVVLTFAFLVLLGMVVWHLLSPIVSAAPAPEQKVVDVNGQETSLTTLCAQYRSDHLMTGDKMDAETREMCGF